MSHQWNNGGYPPSQRHGGGRPPPRNYNPGKRGGGYPSYGSSNNSPGMHKPHPGGPPPISYNHHLDSYPPPDGGPSLKRPRMDSNYGGNSSGSGGYYMSGPPRGYNSGPPPPMKYGGGNGYKPLPNSRYGGGPNQGPLGYNQSLPGGPPSTIRTRVYSDFRIARVRIGNYEVTESYVSPHRSGGGGSGSRDSRLRLYFKNSNDNSHVPPPSVNMSARDRALLEPDRLSISVRQGSQRIVIPVQEGLEKVTFNRKRGHFLIRSYGWALFESADGSSSGHHSKAGHFHRCEDFTGGQLEAVNGIIEVWIDQKHPLPMEPKWTRGNIADYIDVRSKFRTQGVLEVADPEHIVDFDSVVELWTRDSAIGSQLDREAFAARQLASLEYILELTSKVLAPPHYYVSKNAAVSAANGSSSTDPGIQSLQKNPTTVAHILETGQIPALISPSVNALIATTYHLAMLSATSNTNDNNLNGQEKSKDEDKTKREVMLINLLKGVLYQTPEPILWRSLDGLFGKRHEKLNFDATLVLEKVASKTDEKKAAIAAAATTSDGSNVFVSKAAVGPATMKRNDEEEDMVDFGANNVGDIITEQLDSVVLGDEDAYEGVHPLDPEEM
ncbi:hypothetical protein DV495_001863 [Geotrichum candidum]|uniref:Uncharacterized protein n=1 Tax=Geotrichum candidum TaxID=1173061 RepID=A0A0J9X9C4_GEOCN|nr:hypothetical protein DV495_001863 [Geotrichum candidum]KAF7500058.1 hypothetical protein DV113_001949 [Geotrichum candidum]KAI9211609.1 hypothetical protein DS838_003513 [Geotrichum bryndzae]CDO54067.1 hypothetical protein, no similarity [Geotrichum candidum]